MECPTCGASNSDSATFCSLCFGALGTAPEPATIAPEPEPMAPCQPPSASASRYSLEEWGRQSQGEWLLVGGVDPVPVGDFGVEHGTMLRTTATSIGTEHPAPGSGLVGSITVKFLRNFYMNIIKMAEAGNYRYGRNTPNFAREILPKLAGLNFDETIDQREEGDDVPPKVAFVVRSTGTVLMYLAPTEVPGSAGAYMAVYRDISQDMRAGVRVDAEVAAFVEEMLPKLYTLNHNAMVDDVREDDGRVALKLRSTGEMLGYLPRVEWREPTQD